MKTICLITENSRAQNYGIGTYIKQMVSLLQHQDVNMMVVCLCDKAHPYVTVEEINGVRHIHIPLPHVNAFMDMKEWRKVYYKNVFYLLSPYLKAEDELIFHFNIFNGYQLAALLKDKYRQAKLILTVHYMGWSFDLLGDIERLRKILKEPQTADDRIIVESFVMEKAFMNECCDYIVSIARHSHETILKEYKVVPDKIRLIKHGLKDEYIVHHEDTQRELRHKYHFHEKDTILVFAGRLDEVKGLSVLLEAFKKISERYADLKLLVIGDGNMKKYLEEAKAFWSKVTFTGFVDKETLYELYALSDMGVLPSLHEEFGFVAVEMMMQGLPLIVSDSTGLKELVDDTTGIRVALNDTADNQDLGVKRLEDAICHLINHPEEREKMGSNARKKYLNHYELSVFEGRMLNFYNEVLGV